MGVSTTWHEYPTVRPGLKELEFTMTANAGPDLENLEAQPFPRLMGIEIVSAEAISVRARLLVRRELCTSGHILHGGAIMAFADTLGAIGTVLNLPPGAGTATIESKTNFFAPAAEGSVVHAESTPLHIGRRTSVWQTRLTREDGKLLAQVIQTQAVL
jgi:1,4-dihydroxy-2-naphthoyl-CoA hydrolase